MRIGIIGFGRIGAEHAAWIRRARGVDVGAVFDPTPARLALARSLGLRTVDSLDELYGDPAIEAVLVSNPTSMHFDDAWLALMNRTHVMVEKPVALNAIGLQRLIDATRQTGKVLSVFHNRRWDIDYLTVHRAIEEGVFGRVFNVESRLGQWSSCVGPAAREWNPGWRNQGRFGGGCLFDWGSHFLDQLWRMMLPARPRAVFAQLRGNVWAEDVECDDFGRVCIDFDNGATGLVEINTTTTRPLPRWHIDGTLGSASSPFSLAFDTNEWAKLSFVPAAGGSSQELPLPRRGLDEVAIWEQFARACRGECEPAVTAESVVATMVLLDAARESSRTGCAINLSDPMWPSET